MDSIGKIFTLLQSLILLTVACVREPLPEAEGTAGAWDIAFCASPSADVVVSTKGTMTNPASENVVFNLYVLVFDDNGSKVFGQYFDRDSLVTSLSKPNQWKYADDNTMSSGTVRLKSAKSASSENCKIVAIANLNSEMVNITPEQLDHVASYLDMQNLTARLLQEITSRSGYFPMCGMIENVNLSQNSFNTTGKVLSLERLDAKIRFNVQVDPQSTTVTGFTPLKWRVVNVPKFGYVIGRGNKSAVESPDDYFDQAEMNFEEESTTARYEGRLHFYLDWQSSAKKNITVTKTTDPPQVSNPDRTNDPSVPGIENPGNSYYIKYGDDKMMRLYRTSERKYEITFDFDSSWGFQIYEEDKNGKKDAWTVNNNPLDFGVATQIKKDSTPIIFSSNNFPIYGFSFYMLENCKTPTGSLQSYADRYNNAPTQATYVEITGQVVTEEDDETSHAEVKYIVHLGDFGDGTGAKLADFNILRNHSYTYDIYINGIDDIRAEVTATGPEVYPEPSASGEIFTPVRKIYTCDSHYSTHTMIFKNDDIQENKMKWWVRTPFSEGVVSKENGQLPDDPVDYKWMEFRVNFDQREDGEDATYKSKVWTQYQPHGESAVSSDDYRYVVNPDAEHPSPTMYIDELMAFLSAAKKGQITVPDGGKPVFDNNDEIVVTAFVNEYYYEKDPVGSTPGKDLWRKFVNQPMRSMCLLLSSGQVSPDGRSREEKATYIIQQHAIQTVYNAEDTSVNAAWGVEYETDSREKKCENYNGSGRAVNMSYWSNTGSEKRNNSNPDNGRWDTMIEWGLRTAGDETFIENKEWNTYVNVSDGNDDNPFMQNDYKYLRYTCMSRNRDNDGDGLIDKDEVRWYMAASNQLINLFLGSYGLEGSSGLYQQSHEDRISKDAKRWRQHVLASNCDGNNSNTDVRVIWAEECVNGSVLSKVADQSGALVTARCVRNFGYVGDEDITRVSETVAPDYLISVKAYHEGTGKTASAADWDSWDTYKDIYFDIDCSRVNEKSLRYYTDRELAPHDEFNEAACLYKHFRTTSVVNSSKWSPAMTVKQINEEIDGSTGVSRFCPEGYRLPNVRELGIMGHFLGSSGISEKFIRSDKEQSGLKSYFTHARTSWSFGSTGYGHDSSKWGFGLGTDGNYKLLVANVNGHTTQSIRCVKDVKVE